MSKIESAKAIYQRVIEPDFNPHGKSLRAAFIEIAMNELEMTHSGANTYFQNLKNEMETGERYKYRSASKSKDKDMQRPSDPVIAAFERLQQQLQTVNRTLNELKQHSLTSH